MPSRFAQHPPLRPSLPTSYPPLQERYQENCLSLEVPLLNSRGSTAGASRRRRINEVERVAVRTSCRAILEFLLSRPNVSFPVYGCAGDFDRSLLARTAVNATWKLWSNCSVCSLLFLGVACYDHVI